MTKIGTIGRSEAPCRIRVDTVIRHVPRPRHLMPGTSCRFAPIAVVPTGVLIGF